MKAYIRIAGISLSTLIDTGVLVYIISENLVKKFRLKIETNDGTKVVILLEGRSKNKGVKLIRKMSSEAAEDSKTPITKKQVKFLHRIFKLEQLMDNAVHVLVEEINS